MNQFSLILIILTSFMGIAVADIPQVNQYKIEKRPIAIEPSPSQYSISAEDEIKVVKPPFPFFTQLNRADLNAVYTIPPYPDTKQLPAIGKWMIAVATGQKKLAYVPSHWLDDLSASGPYIIEPINYVFVVYSANENDAITKLKQALINSGFTTKWSGAKYHSGNYHAYIGGKMISQLKKPDGVFITFSDDTWLHQNDHFRAMGTFPVTINNKPAYLFAASVSEESAWDQKLYAGHFFVSFAHARSNLAAALISKGIPTYYVISNNVLNTLGETTEDHDGKIFVSVFE